MNNKIKVCSCGKEFIRIDESDYHWNNKKYCDRKCMLKNNITRYRFKNKDTQKYRTMMINAQNKYRADNKDSKFSLIKIKFKSNRLKIQIRGRTKYIYGSPMIGYEYHHFEPYTIDNWFLVPIEEHHNWDNLEKGRKILCQS